MHFKTIALLALAAVTSAEKLRFTRVSPPQFGIVRRQEGGGAYEPEETACGAGDTCAEACGEGFEQCASLDGVNSCFNPGAGEVCCGQGASCQSGFFCTSDEETRNVCCAEGTSLEDCAALNGAAGTLTPDPCPEPEPEPEPEPTTAEEETATAEPTAEPTTEVEAEPTGFFTTTAASNATVTASDTDGPTLAPTTTPPPVDDDTIESAASGVVPAAALLVVGAIACLL